MRLLRFRFPRDDSNSRYRDVQTLGEQAPEPVVRAIIDRRSGQPYLERAWVFAFDHVAARARHHANGQSGFCVAHVDFHLWTGR